MNDFNSSTTGGDQQSTAGTPRYTTFSEAFRSARTDASSIAREAAPKLKQALAGEPPV